MARPVRPGRATAKGPPRNRGEAAGPHALRERTEGAAAGRLALGDETAHPAADGDRAQGEEGTAVPDAAGRHRAGSVSSKRIDSPQPHASTTLGLRNLKPDSSSEVS